MRAALKAKLGLRSRGLSRLRRRVYGICRFAHRRHMTTNASAGLKEWKSWKLRGITLLILFVINLMYIVAIIVLAALSYVRHGFARVQTTSLHLAGTNVKLSLLWTVLPTFILQIHNLCFGAVVDAFSFRQPFIELARGATAKKSIDLNYQSYFPVEREIKAGRRGHWHIVGASFIALLVKLGLGALGSHMMTGQNYDGGKDATLHQGYAFYSGSDLVRSLGWDLSPVLETTSSALIYGGSYPRWSNGTHTFLNLSLTEPLPDDVTKAVVTAPTRAYYAKLDCEVMDDVENHITRNSSSQSPEDNTGRWYLNGTDHGCDWRTSVQISDGFETYIRTVANVNCSSPSKSSFTGRLIVAGVSHVDFHNSLPTVVSCRPTYWTSQGILHFSLNPDSRNSILSFSPNTSEELRPQWWNSFETQLNQVLSVDTTGDGGVMSDSATAFGKIILENARKLNESNPLSGDVLKGSSQQAFEAVYSILVDTFMIRPASDQSLVSGQLIETAYKLFVDNIIAGIVVAYLLAMAVNLIVIYRYTHSEAHRSILYGEPVGLLDYAGLLLDSAVTRVAAAVRQTEQYTGNAAEDSKAVLGQGPDAPTFISIDIDDPQGTRITMRTRRGSTDSVQHAFIQSAFPQRRQTPQTPQAARMPQRSDQNTTSSDGAQDSTAALVQDSHSLHGSNESGSSIELESISSDTAHELNRVDSSRDYQRHIEAQYASRSSPAHSEHDQ